MFTQTYGHRSKRLVLPFARTAMAMLLLLSIVMTVTVRAQRRPVDLVILLDSSTSIGETDLTLLKRAVKNLIDRLDQQTDRVGLIAFAGSVLWGERLGRPGFDIEALYDQIDDVTLDYWTAGGPALGEAWQELSVNPFPNASDCPQPARRRRCRGSGCYEPSPERRRIIILFSDGVPNTIRADVDFTGCTQFSGSGRQVPFRTDINRCGANLAGSELVAIDPELPPRIDGLIRSIGLIEEGQSYYEEFGYSVDSLVPIFSPFPTDSIRTACADLRRRLNLLSDPSQPLELPPDGYMLLPQRDYYNVSLGPVPGVSTRTIAFGPVTADTTTNSFRIPGPFGSASGSNDGVLRRTLNAMARNELENIANIARNDGSAKGLQGITIIAIGLNNDTLRLPDPEWGETGAQILYRVANVPPVPPLQGSDRYNPAQPAGAFAYASSGRDLDAIFSWIALDLRP